jgi:hypothetical protein
MTLISKRIATLRMSEEMCIFFHDLLNNAVEAGIEQGMADFTEEAIEMRREFLEQMNAQGIYFDQSVTHPQHGDGVLTIYAYVEKGLTLPSGLTFLHEGKPIGEIVGYDRETGRLTVDVYDKEAREALMANLWPQYEIAKD